MLRGALVAFLCLNLLACSSTSFFYNRLDFLLPWYVDGFTDLDKEQQAFLDQRLAPFLDWHRASELPCYDQLLGAVEVALDEPVDVEGIEALSRDVEQAWMRTQDEALDWLLALGERLSQEQVEQFIDELRERQGELEDKYLERSDEQYQRDSYDSFRDNAGDYLGRLNAGQRELMREASKQLLRSDRLWLAERAAVIGRIEALMVREPGWQQAMRDMIAAQSASPSPEYARVLQHNIAVIQGLAAEVLNGRTERQDRFLRRRIGNLREDISALAAQAPEPAACSAATAA